MCVQKLILRVKRRDSLFTKTLYRAIRTLQRIEVPAPRFICITMYYLFSFIIAVWRTLARILFYQPIFRARCQSVGRRLFLHQGMPYIYGDIRIRIGDDCTISGVTSLLSSKVFDAPTLTIGDSTYVGYGVTISVAKSVSLGNHVLVAERVFMADNPGHPSDAALRRGGLPVHKSQVKPVIIEDDVWLGVGVMVMPGVTIGRGSIIGAGSVVTRDIPPNSFAAGNPARVIRSLLGSATQ